MVSAAVSPTLQSAVLRARGVSRTFGAVRALCDVDLNVRASEVHALLGENGAGKSTLVKILAGDLEPTAGVVELDGKPVHFGHPGAAKAAGIAVVHQDYNLFDEMSVADNVLSGQRPPTRGPFLARRRIMERARSLLDALGLELEVSTPVGELGAGQRKLVEIARALACPLRVLVLDEPTASLEAAETEMVLRLVERVSAQGRAVLLVTHRLNEVRRVAHRATVLRDGRRVGELCGDEIDPNRIVEMMLGYQPQQSASVSHHRKEVPILRIQGLTLAPGRPPFHIDLHRGEILGLTGLAGSGAVETIRCLAGVGSGRIAAEVNGRKVRLSSPGAAIAAGIGFIPEDRKGAGLVLTQSVATNIVLAHLPSMSRGGWLLRNRRRTVADKYRYQLAIRCAHVDQSVEELSGGNQQKVLIAKWLHAGVPILLLEEPTHGVDVGARQAIHRQLLEFAASGGAIAMLSSEPDELIALCHRIAVFHAGRLVEIVDGPNANPGLLTKLQTGGSDTGPDQVGSYQDLEEVNRV
jgi:ABC-type sugar transport system ATPase subunit